MDFKLKRRKISYDQRGFKYWEVTEESASYEPGEIAVVIVDMWDSHWSGGAAVRCAELAERVDAAVRIARNAGMLIVHAPSETMGFYENSPARRRALAAGPAEPEIKIEVKDYAQPVDATDGGSDTDDSLAPHTAVWTRQSEKIFIDEDLDLVSDEGSIVYSNFIKRGIKFVLYMGVHTNMCVLNRTFAIKAMLRRGMNIALVRDLTDAMYNPERPPYVGHDEGTRLIVEYIEKFYCPTVDGGQLTGNGLI